MKERYARLTEARLTVEEGVNVSKVLNVFKDTVTAEIIGYIPLLTVQRKENAWWTDAMKERKKDIEKKCCKGMWQRR